MTQFRPMLAATLDDTPKSWERLRYPLICSPKVDGIRTYCHPELGPVSRTLKPIPNAYARSILAQPKFAGFDGEICVGPITALDVFNKTMSGIMSYDGTPDFTYHVFDYYVPGTYLPYFTRLQTAMARVGRILADDPIAPISLLASYPDVKSKAEVERLEELCLADGFEGLMLRRSDGIYKSGRSTLTEGHLIKLKRFEDDEATVTGFEPLERNTNEPSRDALGLQKRSSHKEGKVIDSLLGNLICEHRTFGEFRIGSGFDVDLRTRIWNHQAEYLGKAVTFKFQRVGVVDKPRFPIFKGFRPFE